MSIPVLLACLFAPLPVSGVTTVDVHFPFTEYELRVYHIQGTEPGPTVMIIGGIQGNEPGGYLTADQYVRMSLRRGSLIVVPRANFNTIIVDHRGIHGDMNRKFGDGLPSTDQDAKTVSILKDLIAQCDLLLNLHDGSGFYHPTWINALRNPQRYGQSVIADTKEFTDTSGQVIRLADIAERVIARVNQRISNPLHQFHFNNHQTASPDSKHKEQRGSATYYALTSGGIPAFGIETSKSLPTNDLKVQYQVAIINEFMKEFGVIPDPPGTTLPPPQLNFLSIAVNDNPPIVVENGGSLTIAPGDIIQIAHIEANYDRGLSADVEGYGTHQDLHKPLQIFKSTRIRTRKDSFDCGFVQIIVSAVSAPATTALAGNPAPAGDYLLVEINGERQSIPLDEVIFVSRWDTFRLIGVSPSLNRLEPFKLNFYGYPAPDRSAEDRGHLIHLDRDLLPQYSIDRQGTRYLIRLQRANEQVLAQTEIRLMEPTLDYVLIRHNNRDQIWRRNGESLTVTTKDRLEIIKVASNMPTDMEQRITIRLSGQAPQTSRVIEIADALTNMQGDQLALDFLFNQTKIGAIILNIRTMSANSESP